MTGGVSILLIGPLDGMEKVPQMSLVVVWLTDRYLAANDRRR